MSVVKKINITDPTTHVTTLNPIGALAGDVDYDNTTSGLQADDVQEALDEIAANMGEGTAADTTYDNTESGLSADDVQEAIDEIVVDINSLSSSVLSITGDINEIELDIADLSASIVSINSDINNINSDINDIELSISDLSSSVLSINGEIEDIELTIADLSASKLGYDNTQSGLSGDTIQEAIDELAGQDSGHTYKNDSGTSMTQRSNAKFNGIYVEDDSTNNTTNINIVREFQNDAEVQALTGEAAKGFQHTPDNVYRARSAADITFDPTNTLLTQTRMQEAMEELDAAHLPYSSTQSTKQKIDEQDTVVPLSVESLSTSVTIDVNKCYRVGKRVRVNVVCHSSSNVNGNVFVVKEGTSALSINTDTTGFEFPGSFLSDGRYSVNTTAGYAYLTGQGVITANIPASKYATISCEFYIN